MKRIFSLLGLLIAVGASAQVAMEGIDLATLELPEGVRVEAYENDGYRLKVADGIAEVSVDLSVLDTQTAFQLPPKFKPDNSVGILTQAIVTGENTRYGAVSRVLEWVASHVRYELNREQSQDPESVLDRRSAYCTGIAKLATEMLRQIGIPAREVPGMIVDPETGDKGFHRWVEVFYEDKGWVFSDPQHSHHYVPATYIRLADEKVIERAVQEMAVLNRQDGRQPVDYLAELPPGVSVRQNRSEQRSGALKVVVEGELDGMAILEKDGRSKIKALERGRSIFLGVEPGTYILRVLIAGRQPLQKKVVFRDRVRGAVYFPS